MADQRVPFPMPAIRKFILNEFQNVYHTPQSSNSLCPRTQRMAMGKLRLQLLKKSCLPLKDGSPDMHCLTIIEV
jgi:hypothetical protein